MLSSLIRVQFQRVEIWFPRAGNYDRAEAVGVRDAEDVFEGAEAEAFYALAGGTPGHVGALDLFLGGRGLGEEAAPDGGLGAPADGCETGVGDSDGGGGLTCEVAVDFFKSADVPDGHFEVLPGGDHVATFAVDGYGTDRTFVCQ